MSTLSITRDDGVARVVIHNPPANILTIDLINEVNAFIHSLKEDNSIKVVVFTSSNTKFFSAHLDLNVINGTKKGQAACMEFSHMIKNIKAMKQLSIAFVDGIARGGGNEFVMACDLAYGTENALFAQPELHVNIPTGGQGGVQFARRMGKKKVIAETGAGQHGVATATVAARLGLECVVYMGEDDIARQSPNVYRMRLLGAAVVPVTSGSSTLKDAMNEALRYWVSKAETHFYIIGTAAGPHPYPAMVRDFQSIIGEEVRWQLEEAEGRLPDALVACIGGGSNAIGLFHPFLDDESVEIFGVEAAGHGIDSGEHAASLTGGNPGVLHGNRTYLLQDDDGQITEAHSISAGLDYPGIGPEHSWLHESGRVKYVSATDTDALKAFALCSKLEGIIPALEPSHALAYVGSMIGDLAKDKIVVMNLCGRGDKDLDAVIPRLEEMGEL